jgi:hypothetical protein
VEVMVEINVKFEFQSVERSEHLLYAYLKNAAKKNDFFLVVRYDYWLKVNELRNVSLVSSILPKKEQKKSSLILWYLKSNCFCSFFGRIEDTKKNFEVTDLYYELKWQKQKWSWLVQPALYQIVTLLLTSTLAHMPSLR